MKHWDGRDRDDANPLRLPERDWLRVRELFLEMPRPRRRPMQVHSLIGLALALGLLAGLAWALSAGDPVSDKLM